MYYEDERTIVLKQMHAWLGILLAVSLVLAGCGPMVQHNAAGQNVENAAADAADTTAAKAVAVDFLLAQPEADARLAELVLPGDSGSLWYIPQPVLTRADMVNAQARRTRDGQAFVRFTFTQDAAQKLAAITQRFPDKLLVLSVGHKLIRVIQLNGPINSGVLDVLFDSDQQAIGLVNVIAGRADFG